MALTLVTKLAGDGATGTFFATDGMNFWPISIAVITDSGGNATGISTSGGTGTSSSAYTYDFSNPAQSGMLFWLKAA